jgi:hypothetical protein
MVVSRQPTEDEMSTQFRDGSAELRGAGTNTPTERTTLWQRAKHGWPARYPLVQFPNAPLLTAAGGLLVAAVTTGSLHDYASATFLAALGVWAWLELTSGVNWPHRVLGAAGLIYVIAKIAQAFGA